MGIGSLFPFCRGHSEIDTIDHEPWSFGEEVGSCFRIMNYYLFVSYHLDQIMTGENISLLTIVHFSISL